MASENVSQLLGELYSQNKPSEVLRKWWHSTPATFGDWWEHISGTENTWAVNFREVAWALSGRLCLSKGLWCLPSCLNRSLRPQSRCINKPKAFLGVNDILVHRPVVSNDALCFLGMLIWHPGCSSIFFCLSSGISSQFFDSSGRARWWGWDIG